MESADNVEHIGDISSFMIFSVYKRLNLEEAEAKLY